jgi:uncharacterized repeat protein (TIGR02543 family)
MSANVSYQLNGGHWDPKDEMKVAFYRDLFQFIRRTDREALKDIKVEDFVQFEPYVIGNLSAKYYLKEEVGGKFETQPDTHFIGWCYHNHKYMQLIPHLIHFFALWRVTEQCGEKNAADFFASSWAALVDTAKFFKYTTLADLEKSPEAPQVRCELILNPLQHTPELYDAPVKVDATHDRALPNPRRNGYHFIGWYDNPELKGFKITAVSKNLKNDVTYFAKWGTHTFLHSNDGYVTFDELYHDFLKDFSTVTGVTLTDAKERVPEHGWLSHFCKVHQPGMLNRFFSNPKFNAKWIWLINYLKGLNPAKESKFTFTNGAFGDEEQVRFELNSLFCSRWHIGEPATRDYSGAGIKEKLADSTNSSITKIEYEVGETVELKPITRTGFKFAGWFENPQGTGTAVAKIVNDDYAAKTLFAKWERK